MQNLDTGKPSLGNLRSVRRRSVSFSQEKMVETGLLDGEARLPLVITPAFGGVDLAGWAASNREYVEGKLMNHGGILFRGFNLRTADDFNRATRALTKELLEYSERSSPRSRVSDKIYTSTDYPSDQPIFLHNENSYQKSWPMKIFFFCETAAEEGGETPIADTRKVYQRIAPEIRQRFAERKWMYVRNFGDGFGLPWETVFQTSNKTEVESHCRRSGIEVEWKDGNRLRTRAVRRALTQHPKTGEEVWFNHATFFHVSTLEPKVREALFAELDEEDLPANTYYGDGAPIEAEVLDELRAAYRAETVRFPWLEGDLLVLDNMLTAHGRSPFKGERKVLVGMAEAESWQEN